MNGEAEAQSSASEDGHADANGNLNNLGARPKIRLQQQQPDQVVPNEINDENEDNDENSDDDFYIYRYTGNGHHPSGPAFDDDDPLEVADLPKSFFQLDVGSDSEASSLPRSLGGVSGPGQSNLSTEVAALIQSEMAASHLRNHRRMLQQQQQQNGHNNALNNGIPNGGGQRSESPDMEFLEMDFDPGDSESEETKDAAAAAAEINDYNNIQPSAVAAASSFEKVSTISPEGPSSLALPLLPERPQELRLEVVEESEDNFDPEFEQHHINNLQHHGANNGTINMMANGNISVPMHSPAIDLLPGMPRSRSLNSPLTSSTSYNEILGLSSKNCHKRRHSGEDGLCTASSSSSASISAAEVNMELCGARLSNREALVFGVPGSSTSSSSNNVHRAMLKLRMLDRNPGDNHQQQTAIIDQLEHLDGGDRDRDEVKENVDKTMIWSELEACKRQTNQVGVSHCGATALINVLQALEFPHTIEEVIKIVPTKLRAENASVSEYLFSRSVAGTTHQDLIDSMEKLTEGQIKGRFFSFYPERNVSLLHWLAKWIQRGAVPILTINLQKGFDWLPGQTIPDSWHHQMVFGVCNNGVFLTNPLESVGEQILSKQLSSPSEILIRRNDIISKWNLTCDLQSLMDVEDDERWEQYNVIGQVINVLREEHQKPANVSSPSNSNANNIPNAGAPPTSQGSTSQYSNPIQRTHVKIPASYKSGVTLFVNSASNAECYNDLFACQDLPLKIPCCYNSEEKYLNTASSEKYQNHQQKM